MKRFWSVLILAFVAFSTSAQGVELPGIVVNHSPVSKGKYLGSPSICILPNGRYVASHDYFGPKTKEFDTAITEIFVSDDKGLSWRNTTTLKGQFWSTLFCHKGDVYILGTCRHHGNIVIRKSSDNGESWTEPYNSENGLIAEGEYHTAPTPVMVVFGRPLNMQLTRCADGECVTHQECSLHPQMQTCLMLKIGDYPTLSTPTRRGLGASLLGGSKAISSMTEPTNKCST